jgi:hypothetical protein
MRASSLKHGMTIENGGSITLSFRAKSRNPVALLYVTLGDPSTPLRFAQDDARVLNFGSYVHL